ERPEEDRKRISTHCFEKNCAVVDLVELRSVHSAPDGLLIGSSYLNVSGLEDAFAMCVRLLRTKLICFGRRYFRGLSGDGNRRGECRSGHGCGDEQAWNLAGAGTVLHRAPSCGVPAGKPAS